MKKDTLRDALSGINKDYLAESNDFNAVTAYFRKARNRKLRLCASTLCLAFIGIGIIGTAQSGLLNRNLQTAENNISTISSSESNPSVTGSAATSDLITTEQQSVSENTIINTPLYYSKLTKNIETPELDGYDMSASLDIVAFDESMLNDSVGVIAGEIIDLYVKQYEYATASNKFEPNGLLYHKPTTVAYKIRVDRVLSGDFNVGDEVMVEDYYFVCDSIVSIKKGNSYVIPIGKGDGKFYESDEIVSGDTALESCYYTIYQFHPQIEKVNGGYIVPSDWKTLITEDCSEIIIDIDKGDFPFFDSLYYVPESIFNDRMNLILQNNAS